MPNSMSVKRFSQEAFGYLLIVNNNCYIDAVGGKHLPELIINGSSNAGGDCCIATKSKTFI